VKVTVFGTGYVGLVQGVVLADVGNTVMCVDIDESKIEGLRQGHIPIYEPGLEELVLEGIRDKHLLFTTSAAEGVAHSDLFFIAVGTPPDEDGSADLKYVLAVAGSIAEHMQRDAIVVNKSTVPVGTADRVARHMQDILDRREVDYRVSLVSNPEFLKEGAAVLDCQKPDRIIIGTADKRAESRLRELYAPFNRTNDRIITMDVRSAELTKYAANCMLATKISFMNEMANLAERLGADIEHVRHGIGSDHRIGYSFIYPGCGYGGSCFPKDVKALIQTATQIGYDSELLKSVEAVNHRQKRVMFNLLHDYFQGDLAGKTIAVWGLSFKPNTDDMREASSRVLLESLWYAGASVRAYDPEAREETARIYGNRPDLTLVNTREEALTNADALAICTEWKQFRAPDFDLLREQLRNLVIVDGRNMYDPEHLKELGFTYFGIGRGESVARNRVF
jgi:UDPglucose 6-dehydrogenase